MPSQPKRAPGGDQVMAKRKPHVLGQGFPFSFRPAAQRRGFHHVPHFIGQEAGGSERCSSELKVTHQGHLLATCPGFRDGCHQS